MDILILPNDVAMKALVFVGFLFTYLIYIYIYFFFFLSLGHEEIFPSTNSWVRKHTETRLEHVSHPNASLVKGVQLTLHIQHHVESADAEHMGSDSSLYLL